jgi:hypothetical protein
MIRNRSRMPIPLWYLCIPYGLFGMLFVAFALINVYHMVRFGTFGLANLIAFIMFLGGTALILWTTTALLGGVDWSQPMVTLGSWPSTAPNV